MISNEILKSIKKYQYFTVTIGVGNVVFDLNHLKESYLKSKRCLGYRLMLGNNRVIQEEDCAGYSRVVDLLPFQMESTLIHGLEQASMNITLKILDEIFNNIMNNPNRNPEQIKLINRHLISLIYLTASRKGISLAELEEDQAVLLKRVDDLDEVELMKDEIENLVSKYIRAKAAVDVREELFIVKNMKEYVYLHYNSYSRKLI